MKAQRRIKIKTEAELDILRDAGHILADILDEVSRSLKSGITTKDIDLLTEEAIGKRKVIPAFKGYRGFPGCACISVNEEIVHGVPGTRIVKDGDIVSLDVGIIYKEYYSDTASTFAIGTIVPELKKLLEVTEDALFKGIEQARPGNHLSDISHAIQQHVEQHDFSVVREFVGHGIGKNLHEDPEIPNYGPPSLGPVLESGMVFAIEPMVNLGSWQTKIMQDGWTVCTADNQPSAHFEHSIAITKNGPEILTKR